MIRFAEAEAARVAIADEKAGPSILSNNEQCRKDKTCQK